jgi:hypothetical protein
LLFLGLATDHADVVIADCRRPKDRGSERWYGAALDSRFDFLMSYGSGSGAAKHTPLSVLLDTDHTSTWGLLSTSQHPNVIGSRTGSPVSEFWQRKHLAAFSFSKQK